MTRKDKFQKAALDKDYATLLEMALADLEVIKNSPDFDLDMDTWMTPAMGDSKCSVCLAGCVLANSFKWSYMDYLKLIDADNETITAGMLAIDRMRLGVIPIGPFRIGHQEVMASLDNIKQNLDPKSGLAPVNLYHNLVQALLQNPLTDTY